MKYIYSYFELTLITFLPPFQIIHPHGYLPVARHMDKDAFGYLHSGVSRFSVGVVINGPSLSGTERMTLKPHTRYTVRIGFKQGIKGGDVNFEVTNFIVVPDKGLKYTISL